MATVLRFWPWLARAILCIALAITFLGHGAGHIHAAKASDGILKGAVVLTLSHNGADGCAGSSHSKAAFSDCAEHCCPLPPLGASAAHSERLDTTLHTIEAALHDARVALPDEPPRA